MGCPRTPPRLRTVKKERKRNVIEEADPVRLRDHAQQTMQRAINHIKQTGYGTKRDGLVHD